MRKYFLVIILVGLIVLTGMLTSSFIEVYNDLHNNRKIVPINRVSFEMLKSMKIKQPLSIAILGDSKKGTKVLEKLVKEAKLKGCKAVFHLGDIMPYENEKYYKYFYNEFKEMLHDYKVPIFLIPGNHDTRNRKEIYKSSLFTKYFGKDFDIIKIDNVSFIYFDDSSGFVNKKTLHKIKKLISSNNSKLRFLMFHIPTQDPRPNHNHSLHDKKSVKILEDFIKQNRFNAVFSAHIHYHCSYKIGKIPFYISGEAGSYLMLGRDYSFLKLTVENNNFKVKRIVSNWEISLNLIDLLETKIIKCLPF